jgi:hypothetical protein
LRLELLYRVSFYVPNAASRRRSKK